jgi:hypothetical protein
MLERPCTSDQIPVTARTVTPGAMIGTTDKTTDRNGIRSAQCESDPGAAPGTARLPWVAPAEDAPPVQDKNRRTDNSCVD